jgi:hypothetical protein
VRPLALVIVVFVTLCVARVAAAQAVMTGSDDPFSGVHHEHWADPSIPAQIDLVRIDLTNSDIGAYAAMQTEAGQTTSGYAASIGAQVAINGDSFAAAGFVPHGLAMGSDVMWTDTADDDITAPLHFGRVGETTQAAIDPPAEIETAASFPASTQGIVSGHPLLVSAGAVVSPIDCTDPQAIACERAPRSAAGLSADRNTMTLVVVDGWQTASLGMTDGEVASFLVDRGVDIALAFDSGASATLFLGSGVINHPSDGVEVAVANQLAFKSGSLPQGQLVGLVCRHDVFGCGSDETRWIAGALVTLDDGRQQTMPDGELPFYDFTQVTPRLACVTVQAAGYLTVHQCIQVTPGMQTYNSVAMWEGSDPVDAGVPDAPTIVADAPTLDGPLGDAGAMNPATGTGGGCCQASGDPAPAAAIALALLGLTVRRARRYNRPT